MQFSLCEQLIISILQAKIDKRSRSLYEGSKLLDAQRKQVSASMLHLPDREIKLPFAATIL